MQLSNYTPANSGTNLLHHPDGNLQNGVLHKEITIDGIQIKQSVITDLPYQPRLKERAKLLRRARNLPEVLFWMQVTKGNFHKIDFDRQRIIGNYIVDFYIKALGLIIEIDGSSHDDKELYDKVREDYLISLGLKIYRITVDDIMKNMDFVKMGLEEYIIEHYGVISG
ncbi:endonuclease domain-containing protein [Pedobacter jejuensis]|uniref:DUF559 domain-containing protein n=1 Tax=Pedobacter jejuensis TaxID=1268550 RepID=A0A3N0BZD0_9SPHI|nr:endonuclease domain-containing protein [Pedobacter jejuensis]RNL55180.1 DUF559 domain-containing protein [Pedobacter jejuensis]